MQTDSQMTGKLILIVGPSGSGKGTLIQHIREHHPEIVFPVSCTTRAMRPGEKEGEVYYFLTDEEFDKKVAEDAFVEWANYGGKRYGTLKSELFEPLKAGKVVLREVEVQGARAIKKLVPPENLSIIFITAGSWEELVERIQARAPMSEDELAKRRARYEDEITFIPQVQYVLENKIGNVEDAKARLDAILSEILNTQ